jgi:hypothetical protein
MSNEEDNLTSGERELEASLGHLTPSPPSFTFQQAQIRAMVAAERRRTRVWQSVAALLAIGVGAAAWTRPAPRVVERMVLRDSQTTPHSRDADIHGADIYTARIEPSSSQPVVVVNGDFAYLHLRDKVLSRGVESLRASRELPAPTSSPRIGDGAGNRRSQVETPWYVDYLFSGGRS